MSEPNKARDYLLALRDGLAHEVAQLWSLRYPSYGPFGTWREEYFWHEEHFHLSRERMRGIMRGRVAEKRSGC